MTFVLENLSFWGEFFKKSAIFKDSSKGRIIREGYLVQKGYWLAPYVKGNMILRLFLNEMPLFSSVVAQDISRDF